MRPVDTDTLAARSRKELLRHSVYANESNMGHALYNEGQGASLSTLSASKDRRRRGRWIQRSSKNEGEA